MRRPCGEACSNTFLSHLNAIVIFFIIYYLFLSSKRPGLFKLCSCLSFL